MNRDRLWIGALVLLLALCVFKQLQREARLREENRTLSQKAESVASLEAENHRLSRLLAEVERSSSPDAQPAAPAPPSTQPALPEAPAAATNWFGQMFQGGDGPRLNPEQVQKFLAQNARSPLSLITAFRATGDTNLLREALERYANDPQVNFAAAFKATTPDERRQRVEALKQATPDNAIGNYLAAADAFKGGQRELAIQEMTAGSGKQKFDDFTRDFLQSSEEAWRAAGYSVADAKTISSMQLPLPDLADFRQLGRETVAAANAYNQAGDEQSAQALLAMNITLGQRFNGAPGEPLINQLVGIAVESDTLKALDPNSSYGGSGTTIQNRLDELTQQKNTLKGLAKAESLLEIMPPEDVISYWDRWRTFGSEATLRWAESKYGQK